MHQAYWPWSSSRLWSWCLGLSAVRTETYCKLHVQQQPTEQLCGCLTPAGNASLRRWLGFRPAELDPAPWWILTGSMFPPKTQYKVEQSNPWDFSHSRTPYSSKKWIVYLENRVTTTAHPCYKSHEIGFQSMKHDCNPQAASKHPPSQPWQSTTMADACPAECFLARSINWPLVSQESIAHLNRFKLAMWSTDQISNLSLPLLPFDTPGQLLFGSLDGTHFVTPGMSP